MRRGFFCQDPKLSLPLKKSTIPDSSMFIFGFGVPILIWIIEITQIEIKTFWKSLMNASILAFKYFFYYSYICFSMLIIVDIIKNLSGVQRPYFFNVCIPDLAESCIKGSFVDSNYTCQNENVSSKLILESEKSFPSGHASVAVYSCIFFMWYMKMKFNKHKILLCFVNLICLIWIAICCVTRVTDNWHHTSDVIAGMIIAIPFVIYSVSE